MRVVLSLVLLLISWSLAQAEPYLAVKTGYKCSVCHVNPSGGGKRTAVGNAFGSSALVSNNPAYQDWKSLPALEWKDAIALGGDVRFDARATQTPHQQDSFEFIVNDAQVYTEIKLLGDAATLYIDESVAPGGAANREAWAKINFASGFYLKTGKLFLPFGWRLEDDSAFVRQTSGINMTVADTGMEVGLETNHWSLMLTASNGTNTNSDDNVSKQLTGRIEHIRPGWRLGVSYNRNQLTGQQQRDMQALFAGLNTGRIAWLAEVDRIHDDAAAVNTIQLASLLEANWTIRQGHNLKFTYEHHDPSTDIDENERNRYSLVWELVPMRLNQLRLGYRMGEGIPQIDRDNADLVFIQHHIFF